jgi:hypothetical protein
MDSVHTKDRETAGSGLYPSDNLALNLPLGKEKDRPLPITHVYVHLFADPSFNIVLVCLCAIVKQKSDQHGQLCASISKPTAAPYSSTIYASKTCEGQYAPVKLDILAAC